MRQSIDPLRILILGLNFAPEPTGIGKFTGDMAAYLAKLGHDVHVITAPPYYPQWKVQDGYHAICYQRETFRGIRVTRCPLWVPEKPTGLRRSLHLLSFAVSSFPAALVESRWKPQVVMTIAPTILTAPAALLVSRMTGAHSWLHIQDFEIEASFELGLLRGDGLLQRAALAFERYFLHRFDRVSSISSTMLERARQKGVAEDRLVRFPNWVDLDEIAPTPADRKVFGIPTDKVIALYSGNLGEKQGLSLLFEVAEQLKDDEEIQLVICGEGAQRQEVETLSEQQTKVSFLELQPRERLNELLNCADMHLLPQLSGVSDLVMPSKLAAMMASGKPTVASAEPGSGIGQALSGAGIVTPPGEASAMARAILELVKNPERRDQLGASARQFAVQNCSKEAILGSFLQEIEDLGNQG